ncbi:MAG: P1 family peptidase [Chloroflexi bacterium]|nr:P1 family peptidase [Chloroflexota bacterium]
MFNAITDIPGILVGHDTDLENATGCTVILCPPQGAIAGVDARGPAPATRETDLLRPAHLVERAHAIVLTGGSAFGLEAAAGVMKFLEEKNIGFETRVARVPIVHAAAIFDLGIGSAVIRPTPYSGYRAALSAQDGKIEEGNVGAGTGATVGKILGMDFAMKGGLGTASELIANDVIVGALVVVNAFGDVVNPNTGEIIAGARHRDGKSFLDSARALRDGNFAKGAHGFENTTLAVVATNAALTKEQVNLIAMMAHDGIARALRPAHTLYDGDVIFALSAGDARGDVNAIGHAAAELIAQAIGRAVNAAESLHGVPSRKNF